MSNNESIKDMTAGFDLEESVYLFQLSDHYIINNLLGGNMNRVWEVAEKVNNHSKGMLQEHTDGVRTLEKKWIENFQRRIYDKLDDTGKAKVIKTAKNDISNILDGMKPSKNKIMLYRNAWVDHQDSWRLYEEFLPGYNMNDTVEFKIISSTSKSPVLSPDTESRDFYRYEITVPENGFILELDQVNSPVRNQDEVLLPPMKCKVKNVRKSDNEKCRGIIELEYIEKLPVKI